MLGRIVMLILSLSVFSASGTFAQNPETVKRVQSLLWNLGYSVSQNGLLDEQTESAILQFRVAKLLPPHKYVDAVLMNALENAPIPKEWSVLAFSTDGMTVVGSRLLGRAQAERDAMAMCETQAKSRCSIVSAPHGYWLIEVGCLAVQGGQSGVITGGGKNPDREAALRLALHAAKLGGGFPDKCLIRAYVAPDGSREILNEPPSKKSVEKK